MPDEINIEKEDSAEEWAREFMLMHGKKLHEINESLMIGWFANAIERAHDYRMTQLRAANADKNTTEI